jgi:putative tryptophan/tyrosine transport system substrate-binding protein
MTACIRRREFITLLIGGGAVWPLAARAQQAVHMREIAVWMGRPNDTEGRRHAKAFRDGLQALGWTVGRNVRTNYHWVTRDIDRTHMAEEIIEQHPDVIVVETTVGIGALSRESRTIPMIFVNAVEAGFVASLARPGGNVTGMSLTAGPTLSEKWLEILKETFPEVSTVAILTGSGVVYLDRIQAAATMLGVNVQYFTAQDPQEIDRALSEISVMSPGGLVVESDANLVSNRAKIIDFVARHRLPTVYGNLDYIPDGGVMAYFTSIFETWRRLATYVDRILKGAKPGDLPVEQAVKFELVVNLKAAKAIGLSISESMLLRADEVIE